MKFTVKSDTQGVVTFERGLSGEGIWVVLADGTPYYLPTLALVKLAKIYATDRASLPF